MMIVPARSRGRRTRRVRATTVQFGSALELSADPPHAPTNTRVPYTPRRGDEGDSEQEQEAEPFHGANIAGTRWSLARPAIPAVLAALTLRLPRSACS